MHGQCYQDCMYFVRIKRPYVRHICNNFMTRLGLLSKFVIFCLGKCRNLIRKDMVAPIRHNSSDRDAKLGIIVQLLKKIIFSLGSF